MKLQIKGLIDAYDGCKNCAGKIGRRRSKTEHYHKHLDAHNPFFGGRAKKNYSPFDNIMIIFYTPFWRFRILPFVSYVYNLRLDFYSSLGTAFIRLFRMIMITKLCVVIIFRLKCCYFYLSFNRFQLLRTTDLF